jgi:aspartate/glutamate racemase
LTGARIVLIHATPVAMQPVHAAFAEAWPEAEPIDLLDSALSPDRAAADDLTPALTARLCELADYAERRAGAAGILFTCSAFGAAIAQAARRTEIPVLKPNEAMFGAALDHGNQIGLLATFAPSIGSMTEEFEDMCAAKGSTAALVFHVVPEAMTALRAGDAESHNHLVAAGAEKLKGCSAVMLAHFSTARARAATEAVLDCPVLTAPHAAVEALRRRLGS